MEKYAGEKAREMLLAGAIEESSLEKLNEWAASREGAESDINHLFLRQLPGWNNGYAGEGTFNSALHFACWKGSSREFVERLLEFGADIRQKSQLGGYYPIHLASFSGNIELVNLLLDREGSELVNLKDQRGLSPLHWSARGGSRDIVKLLIKRGSVGLHDRDVLKRSPLQLAASNGRYEVVEELLDCGANMFEKEINGYTPLHAAAQYGRTNVVELLIARGAYIGDRAEKGFTPTHLAAQSCSAAPEDRLATVTLLLDRGANIREVDDFKYTPLLWASQQGNVEIISLLLDRGSDIHEKDKHGRTSFMLAALKGHRNVVKLLIERGSEINTREVISESSALHHASCYSHTDVMELLIDSGLDPNTKNKQGKLPLHLCCHHGAPGCMESIQLLLSRGSYLHDLDNMQFTAHRWAKFRNLPIVCDVLERWPVSMVIIVLQELFVYNQIDITSFIDFYQFFE